MTLLLTLSIQSLDSLIESGEQDFFDIPTLTSETLQLGGIMIDASHLSGWDLDSYDTFRNKADKAKSPCLLVRDNTPMNMAESPEESLERIQRLSIAANRLGCNAVAITPTFPDDKSVVDTIVEQLREAMLGVERLELNLLLQPCEGLTSNPDNHIDIIKQIGGFRIGALPTFGAASASGNGLEALRKLAPYAGGIVADIPAGRGKKNIDPVDGLRAICEVGYSNTVAINYRGSGNTLKELAKVTKKMQLFLSEGK